jgi:ArsR family transcriptional regulator
MKKTAAPTASRIDRMFRAFSDRTRLRILYLLQSGECCVGNVVDILQIEQPSASRHLAYLRKAGLAVVRRAAQWNYYSLAQAREPFHEKLLECLACCCNEVPELRADQARAERVRAAGGCCPGEGQPAAKAQKGKSGGKCCPET